jgi:glycosyltransferase involved in cell wall biosynthesis
MTPPDVVTSVSAFFPCYNDELSITTMVVDVDAALRGRVADYEIIVVDDGSSDRSAEVLERLRSEVPALRVVRHERNRGYGGALISGFGAATKEWIFYTDGDAQYDAAEIVDLIAAARPSTDIVQGWKISRGDGPVRAVIGRSYHHVVRLLFSLPVRDTDCDFRLFRRSLLAAGPLRSTSGVICVEMMRRFSRSGAEFVQVPVHHYPRQAGRSQFLRISSIIRSARQLAALWWTMVVRGQDLPRS